jgi:hypothetical protein
LSNACTSGPAINIPTPAPLTTTARANPRRRWKKYSMTTKGGVAAKPSPVPMENTKKNVLQKSYWTKGSYWLSWSHHFESFMIATMTCLTFMEYLCHKCPWICSACCKHFPVLFSFVTSPRC